MPNQFAWKSHFIRYTFEHSNAKKNGFWIDSGIGTFSSIQIVLECIEQLMEDLDCINHIWTQDKCIDVMAVADS